MIKTLARLLTMRTMRELFIIEVGMGKLLKKHLSIKQQVDLLECRGLTIEDHEEAEQFLEHVNYYRFSGYLFDFRESKDEERYQRGSSFHTISRIYEFDSKFTRILMYALEDVEETIKTRFSYTLSSSYPDDPLIYLNEKIYKDKDELDKFKDLFDSAIKKDRNLPFVKHHIECYNGKLPIWVAVEIMTMGNIQALYDNLVTPMQKAIAMKYQTGPVQLSNWLRNLTFTRNHLAHYMRVYNYSFGRIPRSCKRHPVPARYCGKIFDQIAVMSFLFSNAKIWNDYVLKEIETLFSAYRDAIDLKALGFPGDWKEVLMISEKDDTISDERMEKS